MTDDEAVEQFSAAYDGLLSADEQRVFDATLAADEELRREYAEFCRMLKDAQRLTAVEAPNLLPGIQGKLRARSRGRFYRDRFAVESRQSVWALLILSGAMFVVVVVAWVLLSYVEVRSPSIAPADAPSTTQE